MYIPFLHKLTNGCFSTVPYSTGYFLKSERQFKVFLLCHSHCLKGLQTYLNLFNSLTIKKSDNETRDRRNQGGLSLRMNLSQREQWAVGTGLAVWPGTRATALGLCFSSPSSCPANKQQGRAQVHRSRPHTRAPMEFQAPSSALPFRKKKSGKYLGCHELSTL